MHTIHHAPEPAVPSGVALAVAGSVAFAGIGAGGQLLHGLPLSLEIAAVLLCAAVAWLSTPAAGISIALFTWALINGFVLNRYGQLSWHGSTDMSLGLWLLSGACVTGLVRQLTRDIAQVHRPSRTWIHALTSNPPTPSSGSELPDTERTATP